MKRAGRIKMCVRCEKGWQDIFGLRSGDLAEISLGCEGNLLQVGQDIFGARGLGKFIYTY